MQNVVAILQQCGKNLEHIVREKPFVSTCQFPSSSFVVVKHLGDVTVLS